MPEGATLEGPPKASANYGTGLSRLYISIFTCGLVLEQGLVAQAVPLWAAEGVCCEGLEEKTHIHPVLLLAPSLRHCFFSGRREGAGGDHEGTCSSCPWRLSFDPPPPKQQLVPRLSPSMWKGSRPVPGGRRRRPWEAPSSASLLSKVL